MLTFSINIGLPTEATTYNLIGATSTDLSVPLSVLYDNKNKEITPGDLRNSILTLWSNSIFKQTTISGREYIGIDTGNPSDRDLKNKIYLGKRAYTGTFSYNPLRDIMSSTLLNSQTDIFLYNTKRDTLDNRRTRASILTGTNSGLWPVSPYIESQVVLGTIIPPPSFPDGTLNQSFNSNLGTGFDAEVWSVEVQSDGKILVGGQFTTLNGNSRSFLVRLNSGGTEDTSFYSNLGTGLDSTVYCTQLQPDGKILIGGGFTTLNGNSRNYLVRLNSDGTEDTSFYSNLGSGFNSTVLSFAIQPDGKILVGGGFSDLNGNTRNRLVRLNSDGTEDTSFYTNLGGGFNNGGVTSIKVQSDGKILVGGDFTLLDVNTRNRLVRLNSDGTEDTSFYTNLGTGFNQFTLSIAIQPDGKILVGGRFTALNGNTRRRLVRLNSNGTEDTSFYTNLGTSFNSIVVSVKLQADGKILVGGRFANFNGNSRNYLVRLTSSGTEDMAFYTNLGTGFDSDVNSIDLQTSLGRIYVGGYFFNLDTFSTTTLVSLYNSSIIPIVATSSSPLNTLSLNIVNPTSTGGDLKISAGLLPSSTSTVSLNDIVFPSFFSSYGSASNNRLLFWNSGLLKWDDISVGVISSVGTTGSAVSIFGSPVYLNGYPLELTESRKTPISIGDIAMGETFSMVEAVEVLRRIVYTYLGPLCSVSLLPPYTSGYVEVGTTPTVKLKYTITKRTANTTTTGLVNMVPFSYPPITSAGTVTISGTANGIVISPVGYTTTTFTINTQDVNSYTSTNSTTLTGIYPYFYGFSSLTTMTTAGLGSLTKLVEPKSDKTIDVSGSGNLYFIYPDDPGYPSLTSVIDYTSTDIISLASVSTEVLSSPTGLWASKPFKVYKWSGIPLVGPPSVNYTFVY